MTMLHASNMHPINQTAFGNTDDLPTCTGARQDAPLPKAPRPPSVLIAVPRPPPSQFATTELSLQRNPTLTASSSLYRSDCHTPHLVSSTMRQLPLLVTIPALRTTTFVTCPGNQAKGAGNTSRPHSEYEPSLHPLSIWWLLSKPPPLAVETTSPSSILWHLPDRRDAF
ncbi:hypothetical protein SODALDRAFT_133324 [Sodiomyces alkalinus F11]|uniref:Uncharacterized protein n=1 Tax=Sodiomyces alkalinus (strain CBS 110278 / VKM F-3762 / F11) TaxID=1314773 RepID=A0A3N2PYI6_SODAK|nr:hypothetical protein SODALDRAFT_133324 [Sodiomyces alkalinus F11]ROT39580.1 hypothetical protein SODALDRAFT_133324 [Sodiomyces alkalinus F11]